MLKHIFLISLFSSIITAMDHSKITSIIKTTESNITGYAIIYSLHFENDPAQYATAQMTITRRGGLGRYDAYTYYPAPAIFSRLEAKEIFYDLHNLYKETNPVGELA